uniref:Cytochrome b5 heme-binding domain-containing protein n=1 Tax=Meloidogyne floridensis TaxID=298350 RepID=A0A915NIY5_9BILA
MSGSYLFNYSTTSSTKTQLINLKKRPSLIDKLPIFTREDVSANVNRNWIIVGSLVFDLTDFLKIHPGGDEILLEFIGMDATSVFEDVHPNNVRASIVLLKYVIGRLKEENEKREINEDFENIKNERINSSNSNQNFIYSRSDVEFLN